MPSQPVTGYLIRMKGHLWVASMDFPQGAEPLLVNGYHVCPVPDGLPSAVDEGMLKAVDEALDDGFMHEGRIDIDVDASGRLSLPGSGDVIPVRWCRNGEIISGLPEGEISLISGIRTLAEEFDHGADADADPDLSCGDPAP